MFRHTEKRILTEKHQQRQQHPPADIMSRKEKDWLKQYPLGLQGVQDAARAYQASHLTMPICSSL